MTLLISNENVQAALDSGQLRVEGIIDAIEGAYRDLGTDTAIGRRIDRAGRHR